MLKVLEFSHNLNDLIPKLNIEKKSMGNLYNIYIVLRDNFLGDVKLILDSLREAEYILPNNISYTVLNINRQLDCVCSKFIEFGALKNILTEDELIKETIKQNISIIEEASRYISSKENFITSIMPNELNISNLDL